MKEREREMPWLEFGNSSHFNIVWGERRSLVLNKLKRKQVWKSFNIPITWHHAVIPVKGREEDGAASGSGGGAGTIQF